MKISLLTDLPNVNYKMKENTKVLKNRIALAAVAGSAALIPLAGISALTTGVASAKAPKGFTCSTLKTSVNLSTGAVKSKFSGCTGNTGTKGKEKGTETAPGPIKWANGKSTSATESDSSGTFTCPSGGTPLVITGSVTADTTGSTSLGAPVSANVCYNSTTSTVTLEPGTKFTFGA